MELLIAFGITLLTQLIKKFVYPKFGSYGVHALIFILSLAGVSVYYFVYTIPEWQVIIQKAIQTLAYSVAIYEIILKKVGFGKIE